LWARLFQFGGTEYLCALHRGDSFLSPDPLTRRRRHAVYRFTDSGFHRIDDDAALAACQKL
jgi:hypothetical protein